MNNILKTAIAFFILIFLFGLYFLISFNGVFDKKYSREELVKEFIANEKDFAELEAFFISSLPTRYSEKVSFGLGKGNKVSLKIFPNIISPGNRIIGGDDLNIGSHKLDSALKLLGWTNETLKTLRGKLGKTNCDWITTTESSKNLISVYPSQSGWQKYSYIILEKPISDSLIKVYGAPISNSEFGKRVILSYHAAL